ncbi:hypothetical protein ABZ611_33580 [Streptomyces sp. NPDC007861]|uniref:hypothetical protein n=1 Tax=Streptomyces sp. NPDC007861 TaxID=3154893 RepID=UPI0033FEF8CF
MTQQFPGPQQPHWGQPAAQPQWGQPPFQPQPPKKGMSSWAIAGIIVGGFFACLIVLGVVAGGDDTATSNKPSDKVTVAASSSATPTEQDPDEALKEIQEQNKKNRDELQKQIDEEAKKDGQFDDGDYVIGEDIPPGTYTTTGAEKGLFELCTISTEPTDDSTWPQLKSANADERIIITLKKSDGVVSIAGCEPLTLRK